MSKGRASGPCAPGYAVQEAVEKAGMVGVYKPQVFREVGVVGFVSNSHTCRQYSHLVFRKLRSGLFPSEHSQTPGMFVVLDVRVYVGPIQGFI